MRITLNQPTIIRRLTSLLPGSDAPNMIPRSNNEKLKIESLVYPLRFDIVIRRRFFQLYKKNSDLFARDQTGFVDLAKSTDYYLWFKNVMVRRFHPELTHSQCLDESFHHRVVDAVRLFQSIQSRGFDENYPLEIRTGKIITAADSGRVVDHRLFIWNGCHRLAALLMLGYQHLPPHYYQVFEYKEFRPIDNSALLDQLVPTANWQHLVTVLGD